MTATMDLDTAVVLMTVYGTWSAGLRKDVSAGYRKCLSEHPSALIVDLHAMTDADAEGVATWVTAASRGRGLEPPVPVLFCAPLDTRLAGRMEVLRLAVFATVEQARAAVTRQPAPQRMRMLLPPVEDAPRLARRKVTEACLAWDLLALMHRGRLVVSELVANSVEHAGTPITVLISRRATGLHVIVSDDDPRLPRLVPPWPAPGCSPEAIGRGRGLRLVDAAATGWGAMPVGAGKMVWATLHGR